MQGTLDPDTSVMTGGSAFWGPYPILEPLDPLSPPHWLLVGMFTRLWERSFGDLLSPASLRFLHNRVGVFGSDLRLKKFAINEWKVFEEDPLYANQMPSC